MQQIVFEIINGRAMPRIPREPDGKRFLSLQQAADATGRTVAELREFYRATFAELLTGEVIDLEEPETTEDADVEGVHAPDPGSPTIPVDPTSPSAVAPHTFADARRRLAHALHFPNLTDEQFNQVEAFAAERKFDLLSRHLWAEARFDYANSQQHLFIGLTIEGFRTVAHRTGQYAGCDETRFTFDEERTDDADPLNASRGPRRPSVAIATVYRNVNGKREKFTGEAVWEELAGAPGHGDVLTFRQQAPRTWLAKCAKAAALREAFPNELGGMYTPEEMSRTLMEISRPRRQPEERDSGAYPASQPTHYANPSSQLPAQDESVCSQQSFNLALIDEGISSPHERQRILDVARQRLRHLASLRDPAAFYGHAINDFRQNRRAYGLAA